VSNRLKYAIAASALGVAVLTACSGGHGTGSITPSGTTHGTFHYCSYTPTGSGIKISRREHTPCVVEDTRSTKDRKKTTTPSSHAAASTHSSSTRSSAKKTSQSTSAKKH
jgi:hypothetical protein